MLVLTRRMGERIFIDGGRVVVKVLGFHGKSVRLGLDADAETRILRAELEESQDDSQNDSEINDNPLQSKEG